MPIKLVSAATGMVVIGALAAFGPMSAQAKPTPGNVYVPCTASALATALATAGSGETLVLTEGCTYLLTAALPDISDTSLTIVGNGATLERSTGESTPDFPILTVDGDSPGNLTLVNVNFVNGGGGGETDYYGGAIYNEGGNVTVRGGNFSANYAGEDGGAIYNDGTMTVTGASFTGNTVDDDDAYGGAIYNDGTMTISASVFHKNSAEYGGAIYNDGSAMLTADSFVQNNAYEGGGLYNEYEASATNSSFGANLADYGAGIYNDYCGDDCDDIPTDDSSLTLLDAKVMRNVASYQGGGIYNEEGAVTVNGGFITFNSASSGGGIYNDSDYTVTLNDGVVASNKPDNCSPAIAGCAG